MSTVDPRMTPRGPEEHRFRLADHPGRPDSSPWWAR